MICYMIDTAGRQRIAELVKRLIVEKGLTNEKVAALPGRPHGVATIERVRAADPKITELTFQFLGVKLGLPYDFILWVGVGDFEKIRGAGIDDDLKQWVIDLIRSDRPHSRRRRRDVTG